MFAQLVVSGLGAGSLYGLMALGLILIHKTTYILNFGQGGTTMLSTFVAFVLLKTAGATYPVAILGAVAAGLMLGFLVCRGDLRIAKDSPVTSLFIATLGVGMILKVAAGWSARGAQATGGGT
jgi:branched-chain amino acid transport system permease protein